MTPKDTTTFYIIGGAGMDPREVDITTEGPEPMPMRSAVKMARGYAKEYGGTWYVIQCKAIRRVSGAGVEEL